MRNSDKIIEQLIHNVVQYNTISYHIYIYVCNYCRPQQRGLLLPGHDCRHERQDKWAGHEITDLASNPTALMSLRFRGSGFIGV